ncbi:hypothetical protein Z043_115779 [Scleropages formosus]|uniref:Claudin n=1 Tax=Scleropages formosus TaxID=113540 RepID=A0A0P7WVS1_SCLFO|nr:hypothetical protein Z043_115779 [Scleropages formosus]
MVSTGLRVGLDVPGLLGAVVSGALLPRPVTAFLGNHIVTMHILWESLWLRCRVQSMGQVRCKVYSSTLALTHALLVVGVLLTIAALLAKVLEGKCTNFVEPGWAKAQITVTAGTLLVSAGFLCLIPRPSWAARVVVQYQSWHVMDRRWQYSQIFTAETSLLYSVVIIIVLNPTTWEC